MSFLAETLKQHPKPPQGEEEWMRFLEGLAASVQKDVEHDRVDAINEAATNTQYTEHIQLE